MKEWILDILPGTAKSLFEVMVTVCFTFLPFAILAIKWPEAEGANTIHSISQGFLSYWQSGEIGVPILGLCGAVAAVLALNKGYFPWWVHSFVLILILVFTLGVGAALMGTGGFNENLNTGIIVAGFVGYAALALTWLLLAARIRTTSPSPRDSGARSQELLEEVNRRRRSEDEQ